MEKECVICHEIKPIKDFYTYTKKQCRPCDSKQNKTTREEKKKLDALRLTQKEKEMEAQRLDQEEREMEIRKLVQKEAGIEVTRLVHKEMEIFRSRENTRKLSKETKIKSSNFFSDSSSDSSDEEIVKIEQLSNTFHNKSSDSSSEEEIKQIKYTRNNDDLENIVRIQGNIIADLQKRVAALEQIMLEMSVSSIKI